ncbi:hypothetical protein IOD13_11565 [Brevibacterium casei]|nr:hypothetical protein [Brevibacterium casei]
MSNRKRRHLQVIDGGSPDLDWDYHPKASVEIQNSGRIDPGLIGDLRAIMRRISNRSARHGEIEIPLQTHPEVGEVRLYKAGRHYRLFVAMPASHVGVIVALRFWRKSGSDEEIQDLQNREIATAGKRLDEWIASHSE